MARAMIDSEGNVEFIILLLLVDHMSTGAHVAKFYCQLRLTYDISWSIWLIKSDLKWWCIYL